MILIADQQEGIVLLTWKQKFHMKEKSVKSIKGERAGIKNER
jgi:hypothetical protein